MIDQVRVWQWLVVAEGVAVAGWMLRDKHGCELGIILSGEKSKIGCILSEIWWLSYETIYCSVSIFHFLTSPHSFFPIKNPFFFLSKIPIFSHKNPIFSHKNPIFSYKKTAVCPSRRPYFRVSDWLSVCPENKGQAGSVGDFWCFMRFLRCF
jgi:hypothetical protein